MKQLRVFVPDQPPGFANYHGKQDDLYLFLKALRKGTHIELHLFWPAESHEWSTATVRGEFDRLVERPACTPEIVLRPGFEGVEHDLLGAARALCGKEEGIAAILGTGSNSCYFDGKKIKENITALGFI